MSVYIPPIYTQMTDLMKQRAKINTSLFIFMFRILKPKTPCWTLHQSSDRKREAGIRAKSPQSFTLSCIIYLLLNKNVGHVEIMWIYVTCIDVKNIYLTKYINTLCYGSSLDWIDLIHPSHSFSRGESRWGAAVHLNPSDHVSVQVSAEGGLSFIQDLWYKLQLWPKNNFISKKLLRHSLVCCLSM